MPGQESLAAWPRIATLMAGNHRGTWFIPDVNDEVLVAFEAGDVRRPYVIGALWSGTNPPPETMNADNTRKVVRSRGSVTVVLDDRAGDECFAVETPGGRKIVFKDGPGSIEITDNNGNTYERISSHRFTPCGLPRPAKVESVARISSHTPWRV